MASAEEHSSLLHTQVSERMGTQSSYTTCYGDSDVIPYMSWNRRTRPRQQQRPSRRLSLLALFSLLLLFTLLIVLFHVTSRFHPNRLQATLGNPADLDDDNLVAPFPPPPIQKLWAAYAPYYPVEKYQRPPEDCQLTQVNILQRHGARYPTLGLSMRIAQALLKLQAAESYVDERLQFLTKYTYDLGVDDLLPFGVLQTFQSGREAYSRYVALASEQNLPFVRASGSERVIKSAFKWAEGFEAGSGGVLQPPLAVVIPERDGYNNTLDDNSCPNIEHPNNEVQEWQSRYAKRIADRLNSGARGLPERLTPDDAQSLIALCALETVAKEKASPFCGLFSKREFEGFEYAFDLDKFYFTGHGSQLGPVQGVGYINELLARLTDQPVRDRTQTNHTLDSSPDTFPLGRGIYTDFSHDNLMVAVVSAMGLFKGGRGAMDPRKPDKDRRWVTSRIVPFSGRMVVERMECGSRKRGGVYVRVLVNDAVQRLDFCNGADADGLCLLPEFVKSQGYARRDGKGDWERCFD